MIELKYKIPFFDLDWTLIKGGSLVHRKSLLFALQKTFNINADFNSINFQGLVDYRILYELALLNGINKKDIVKNMPRIINYANKNFLINSRKEKFTTLPGAVKLFKKLKQNNIPIGILTGNTKVVGQKKLKKTGLFKYVNYEYYGDMSLDRDQLVRYAYAGINKDYPDSVMDDIVIVGDTPKDIECAKANNIQVISLTTGIYNKKDLHKADLILESLSDINGFMSFIMKGKNIKETLLLNKPYLHSVKDVS